MKRNLLGMAALAAIAAPAVGVAAEFGRRASELVAGDETGTYNPGPPRFNRRRGYTAAQGKRMAEKRRRQLRARGQFRKAVR
jgi:hypothetical protein